MPPINRPPAPEFTDEDIDRARVRGKKLALEQFREFPGGLFAFTQDEAVSQSDLLFPGATERIRKTMAFEIHDAAHRFAAELREIAA